MHRALLALPAVFVALLLAPAANAASTINVCAACANTTIQSGIDAAAPGDTVAVAAGTYNESQVLVNKPVTVQGAGVGQSIIDGGAATLGTSGMVRVDTTAGDVKIDGFTLRNAGGTPSLRIAVILKSVGAVSKTLTFSNNRIEGRAANDYGFDSDHGGMAVKFLNNTVTGTGFNPILIERNTAAVEVRGNTITAPFSVFFMTYSGDAITAPQVVADNTITSTTSGLAFQTAVGGTTVGTFSDVTIENNSISSASGSGISLGNVSTLAGGANGLIANPVVRGNTVVGAAAAASRGVSLIGLVTGARVEANEIRSFATGVRSGTSAAGAHSPSGAVVARNRIVGNGVGLANDAGTALDAQQNWWGCNGGPTASGCGTVTGANVDFDPWLVLGLTASPTSIQTGGETSALSASVNKDSSGATVSGPFFPTTPVTFASALGTVSPVSPNLSAGNTATSTLTSGAVAGAASPNVTLDNATAVTPVTFTAPPAPVIPDQPVNPPPNTPPQTRSGLSLTKVSADRYCIGTGTGAGKDITVRYTLSDAAKVTFTVQRRTAPAARARTVCPTRKPGGPGATPVTFGDLGSFSADNPSGESFATVDSTGKVAPKSRSTGGTAAPRNPLTRTVKAKKGKQRFSIRQALSGQALAPGWYRVLIQGLRADGSRSQAVAVKFWVLDQTRRR
jgi:hypothetical protein